MWWNLNLSGGWGKNPLKKSRVRQLGWWHSQYMGKEENVPNHQPGYKWPESRRWNVKIKPLEMRTKYLENRWNTRTIEGYEETDLEHVWKIEEYRHSLNNIGTREIKVKESIWTQMRTSTGQVKEGWRFCAPITSWRDCGSSLNRRVKREVLCWEFMLVVVVVSEQKFDLLAQSNQI